MWLRTRWEGPLLPYKRVKCKVVLSEKLINIQLVFKGGEVDCVDRDGSLTIFSRLVSEILRSKPFSVIVVPFSVPDVVPCRRRSSTTREGGVSEKWWWWC